MEGIYVDTIGGIIRGRIINNKRKDVKMMSTKFLTIKNSDGEIIKEIESKPKGLWIPSNVKVGTARILLFPQAKDSKGPSSFTINTDPNLPHPHIYISAEGKYEIFVQRMILHVDYQENILEAEEGIVRNIIFKETTSGRMPINDQLLFLKEDVNYQFEFD